MIELGQVITDPLYNKPPVDAQFTLGSPSQRWLNAYIMGINGVPYTFPSVQGLAGTVLTNNGSGVLSWAAAPSVSPALPDKAIQYNNGGAFGGNANFLYDYTTGNMKLGNVASWLTVINSQSLITTFGAATIFQISPSGMFINGDLLGHHVFSIDPNLSFSTVIGDSTNALITQPNLILYGNMTQGLDDANARTMQIYADITIGSVTNPRTVTKYGALNIIPAGADTGNIVMGTSGAGGRAGGEIDIIAVNGHTGIGTIGAQLTRTGLIYTIAGDAHPALSISASTGASTIQIRNGSTNALLATYGSDISLGEATTKGGYFIIYGDAGGHMAFYIDNSSNYDVRIGDSGLATQPNLNVIGGNINMGVAGLGGISGGQLSIVATPHAGNPFVAGVYTATQIIYYEPVHGNQIANFTNGITLGGTTVDAGNISITRVATTGGAEIVFQIDPTNNYNVTIGGAALTHTQPNLILPSGGNILVGTRGDGGVAGGSIDVFALDGWGNGKAFFVADGSSGWLHLAHEEGSIWGGIVFESNHSDKNAQIYISDALGALLIDCTIGGATDINILASSVVSLGTPTVAGSSFSILGDGANHAAFLIDSTNNYDVTIGSAALATLRQPNLSLFGNLNLFNTPISTISTETVLGVARAVHFDMPIGAGGVSGAALDYQFKLGGDLEAGLLANTDGAGGHSDVVWKFPYTEGDYANDWSGYTPPNPASLRNGAWVFAYNTNVDVPDPKRAYYYMHGAWAYVDLL